MQQYKLQVNGKADVHRLAVQHPQEAGPIWQLQPMRKKEEATSL